MKLMFFGCDQIRRFLRTIVLCTRLSDFLNEETNQDIVVIKASICLQRLDIVNVCDTHSLNFQHRANILSRDDFIFLHCVIELREDGFDHSN